MKYLVLGAGGMAGHTISLYLKECGEIVHGVATRNLSFVQTYILDVTKFDDLEKLICDNDYDVVINCVGILNQFAEQNISKSILINSFLPHFLCDITKNAKTKIIQMSTDCVFSGKKGHYSEIDLPDGESIYDRTKALGEINDNKNLTFRNSIIGPDTKPSGIGLFNWFMQQTDEINGFSKSIWTGVTTLTLAKAMKSAAEKKVCGLYNLVNNSEISKYELLCLFNKYSGKNLIINKIDGVVHDKSLINTRKDFDFYIPTYDEQIKEMFSWINKHKSLYSHYFNKNTLEIN